MKTRREFIKGSLVGLAATWTLPTFLGKTIFTLDLQAAESETQSASGKDGPILVVLQLGGGNDGLNTVIPYGHDAYYQNRPKLGIKADQILKLNDEFGLHPELTGLKNFYDSGDLALINGVGYPNPNRSHFRSMEIWQTASDADKIEAYGWLGRYFDNSCTGSDPTVGVNIGSMLPEAMLGPKPLGISLANPERYRLVTTANGSMEAAKELDETQSQPSMNSDPNGDSSGSSIQNLGTASDKSAISNLDYLQRTTLDAELSSQQIQDIAKRYHSTVTYPASPLASELQTVARLIGGGMKTRVYYVNHGGFDTHANQLATHERLLKQLSEALTAFVADLKAQGNFDRVMIMTFSEFGRRLHENASGGTDHGVASPMFVLGGKLKPGTYGAYPSLTTLDHGDLIHNVDFRSVYATMLDKWLQADSTLILKRRFDTLAFI